MKEMRVLIKKIFGILAIITLLLYVPIMGMAFFIGDRISYNPNCRDKFLLSNWKITLLIIPTFFTFFFLRKMLDKVENIIIEKYHLLLFLAGGLYYVFLFKINEYIAEAIAFLQGWDVSVVVGMAYNLVAGGTVGSDGYYITYTNNVPITYILQFLLKHVPADYGHFTDFIWLQTICGLISIAGYFTSILVFRISHRLFPTVLSALMYSALMIMLPQKVVPYTDMFSICFPIAILALYGIYSTIENKWRYVLWIPILIFSVVGILIKSTVVVSLIAIVGTEILRDIFNLSKRKRDLLFVLLSLISILLLRSSLFSYMADEIGFEPIPKYEITWHHYLYMGSMSDNTGAYDSDAMAVLYDNLDKSVEERNKEEIRLTRELISNRTFLENAKHWTKKMLMTFNDGTFTWAKEGAYALGEYPVYINDTTQPFLKSLFWENGKYYYWFTTCCQYMWFVIMFMIPGVAIELWDNRKSVSNENRVEASLLLTLVGIFLFIFLFEARARYLISYIPVYITVSALGSDKYCSILDNVLCNNKQKRGIQECK